MDFVTDLVEVSFDQSFKWKINNVNAADPKKDYMIKSKELRFFEANATWYLKIRQFVYNSGERFLGSTFYLRDDGKDENARYKFSIKLESGMILESQFISKNKTAKSSLLEYQMSQFIPLDEGDNSIVIEPKCILETMSEPVVIIESEEEVLVDDGESEYDTLVDSMPLEVPKAVVSEIAEVSVIENTLETTAKEPTIDDEKRSEKSSNEGSSSAASSSETSKDSDDSDSDESFSFPVEDDKMRPGYALSNIELTRRIRKIYLVKMKQIADTSSRLLVTAARVS